VDLGNLSHGLELGGIMDLKQAKALVRELEKKQREQEKIERDKRAAEEQVGWDNATYVSIPTDMQVCFNKFSYKGWRVNKTNSITDETVGMNYFATRELVLLSGGGGTYTLEEGIIITTKEVAMLNSGKVPERLKRQRNFNLQTGKVE